MVSANPDLSRKLALISTLLILLTAGCKEETRPRNANTQAAREPHWTLAGRISVPKGVDSSGILVFAEGTSYLATTDQDGLWTIRDVPAGSYHFRARREDLQPADISTITLNPQDESPAGVGRHVDLPTVDMASVPSNAGQHAATRTGAVRGVIRLLDGSQDYQGVIVQVAGTEIRTATNAVGEYYFSSLRPGNERLIFSRKDLQTAQATAEVTAGREMPGPIVEMRPAETARKPQRTLRGQVQMADSQGNTTADFTGVLVSLEGTTHVAVPNDQGNFAFTDLPPGTYTVVAAAPGYQLRKKIDVDLTNLEATEVTVNLDQSTEAAKNLGTVTGRALLEDPPESGDQSGILVSLAGTNFVAVTDPVGSYQISNVPPGTYLFRAQAEEHVPEYIENVVVQPGQETHLDDVKLSRYIVPPEVVYTDPGDGATGVAIVRDTPLYVRFSKRMRPDTVKSAFSIDPPVAVRLYMGKENPQSDFDLLFVQMLGMPGYGDSPPLRFSTTYNVTIGTDATDYEDAHLQKPYTFQFTTGEPIIIASEPADGDQAAMVSVQQPLILHFNAQMDHSKFSPADIRFRPDPQGLPTIQAFDDPVSGWTSLQVYVPLELNKEYSVTCRGDWRTVDGARISNLPFRIRFKTTQYFEYKPYYGTKQ